MGLRNEFSIRGKVYYIVMKVTGNTAIVSLFKDLVPNEMGITPIES